MLNHHPDPAVAAALEALRLAASALERAGPPTPPPADQLPRWLRAREVAAALGLSTKHVYDLMARGLLPTVRVNRSVRVPEDALRAYIARQAGGGEEWFFPASGLPYVHANADGTDEGIDLVLHECGHAFHDHLATRQGLLWRWNYPTEMAEFAAIAMGHLAAPALDRDRGGIYDPDEATRRGAAALEQVIVRWLPHIAATDAFQHWLYAEAPDGVGPPDLDAAWRACAARFQPWVDWSGLAAEQALGWRQSGLLVDNPFYMIEYALAHLGALQLWRAAWSDPAGAWRRYRAALALGNTRRLPDLYAAAGVRLPFDRATVRELAHACRARLDDAPAGH